MSPLPENSPLPPGQQLVAPGRWPVVGERRPLLSERDWQVNCRGLVEHERTWSVADLLSLPQITRRIDIHCVTRWSRPAMVFTGIPLSALLDDCQPLAAARYVSFVARSSREHSTSLPLPVVRAADALIAFQADGTPLTEEHGGPVRVVVPGRYFYKSLKWVERIELIADDQLGYWESTAGYHNGADPLREERFLAPSLDLKTVRGLISTRDFRDRDLRGVSAAGLDLRGLKANNARLRDAHFEGADLRDGCFDGANLSGAHLERANLRGASFGSNAQGESADLEGADFRGADLRGARFIGASLFGATFGELRPDGTHEFPVIMDHTTIIDQLSRASLESTPAQLQFLHSAAIP